METKHTPGPWAIEYRTDGQSTYSPRICAGEQDAEFKAKAEANARLIAAAPELLEALDGLCGLAELRPGHLQDYKAAVAAARAAIAKATGSAA